MQRFNDERHLFCVDCFWLSLAILPFLQHIKHINGKQFEKSIESLGSKFYLVGNVEQQVFQYEHTKMMAYLCGDANFTLNLDMRFEEWRRRRLLASSILKAHLNADNKFILGKRYCYKFHCLGTICVYGERQWTNHFQSRRKKNWNARRRGKSTSDRTTIFRVLSMSEDVKPAQLSKFLYSNCWQYNKMKVSTNKFNLCMRCFA